MGPCPACGLPVFQRVPVSPNVRWLCPLSCCRVCLVIKFRWFCSVLQAPDADDAVTSLLTCLTLCVSGSEVARVHSITEPSWCTREKLARFPLLRKASLACLPALARLLRAALYVQYLAFVHLW